VKPYCKNENIPREEKCELRDDLRGARKGLNKLGDNRGLNPSRESWLL